jgi:hypothetical protein
LRKLKKLKIDLVAMMSLSNGMIKVETEDGRRVLNVLKHPKVEATRIEVPGAKILLEV